MRKIIVEEWVSLDGYVSDKNGKLDFFTNTVRETYNDNRQIEHLENIDCMLFGRKTYEQFAAIWPERPIENNLLATKINTQQKIVFSKSLLTSSWGKWQPALIERGNAIAKINELKLLDGKNIVVWGSISLAQLLIKEKLVDELRLHICPVILSGGKKFFNDEAELKNIVFSESKIFSNGNVLLNCQFNKI